MLSVHTSAALGPNSMHEYITGRIERSTIIAFAPDTCLFITVISNPRFHVCLLCYGYGYGRDGSPRPMVHRDQREILFVLPVCSQTNPTTQRFSFFVPCPSHHHSSSHPFPFQKHTIQSLSRTRPSECQKGESKVSLPTRLPL